MQQMQNNVVNTLIDVGLLDFPADQTEQESLAEAYIDVLDAQGLLRSPDNAIELGRCVVLPSSAEELSLLLVTPSPVDEYDEELRRKTSPVMFERRPNGDICLPQRWLLTQIEHLADNPLAPEEVQACARMVSLTAVIPGGGIIVPHTTDTIALSLSNDDGTETVLEALPGGLTFTLEFLGKDAD